MFVWSLTGLGNTSGEKFENILTESCRPPEEGKVQVSRREDYWISRLTTDDAGCALPLTFQQEALHQVIPGRWAERHWNKAHNLPNGTFNCLSCKQSLLFWILRSSQLGDERWKTGKNLHSSAIYSAFTLALLLLPVSLTPWNLGVSGAVLTGHVGWHSDARFWKNRRRVRLRATSRMLAMRMIGWEGDGTRWWWGKGGVEDGANSPLINHPTGVAKNAGRLHTIPQELIGGEDGQKRTGFREGEGAMRRGRTQIQLANPFDSWIPLHVVTFCHRQSHWRRKGYRTSNGIIITELSQWCRNEGSTNSYFLNEWPTSDILIGDN